MSAHAYPDLRGSTPGIELLPAAPVRASLDTVFDGFAPVALAEMETVSLMERRDTKYVLGERVLLDALHRLRGTHRVLEIRGIRVHGYRTVYFDTSNFALFRAHHNDRPLRYKVRSRLYVDSGLAFFEVKAKDKRNHTVKSRTATERLVTAVASEEAAFVAAHAPFVAGELRPRLVNSFSRATLVDLERGERLTLDFGLVFVANGEIAGLPGLVVAELKQPRAGRSSPFGGLMRDLNVHPNGFSKYCAGVSLLYPGVKHNRFNPELRLVRRITGDCDVQ